MDRAFEITHIEENQNKITASVKLKREHAVFSGHFPDKSILPGVVEIELVREIINRHFKKTFELKTAKSIKFVGMVILDEVDEVFVELSVLQNEDSPDLKVNAIIKNNDQLFAKLTGIDFVQ
ncbi:hypothetical protein [Maribellus mangrovi]|uniref:hypothetical protein n=1 Tax=Maribellus mangrovi TaxID=3133146 RepID=UPI0030ECB98A